MVISKRVSPSSELCIKDVKIKYVLKFNNFGNSYMWTINLTFIVFITMIQLFCPPVLTRYNVDLRKSTVNCSCPTAHIYGYLIELFCYC